MRHHFLQLLLLVLLAGAPIASADAAGEQLIGILGDDETAVAADEVTTAGLIDYLELLNLRDGGVSGVRLSWSTCADAPGDRQALACFDRLANAGVAVVAAVSGGGSEQAVGTSRSRRIPMLMPGADRARSLDRRRSQYAFAVGANLPDQAAALVRFIGVGEGGLDRLRGKRIAYLYSQSDQVGSSETMAVLETLAGRWEFELLKLALPAAGAADPTTWHPISGPPPDWLLLSAPGSTTAAVLKTASELGVPARRIIVAEAGTAVDDLAAAGPLAIGYLAVVPEPHGFHFLVVREILKHRSVGRLRTPLPPGVFGSARYNRGVVLGILVGEAIRVAQKRHGAKPLNGQQIRWGLEHLALDEAALARLGALELLPTVQLSCSSHEGGRAVKMQQWLGSRWTVVSDWIAADDAAAPGRTDPAVAGTGAGASAPPSDCAPD